jgi:hypothetical protein
MLKKGSQYGDRHICHSTTVSHLPFHHCITFTIPPLYHICHCEEMDSETNNSVLHREAVGVVLCTSNKCACYSFPLQFYRLHWPEISFYYFPNCWMGRLGRPIVTID